MKRKRLTIAAAVIALLIIAGLGAYQLRTKSVISDLDARFRKAERGESITEVESLMGGKGTPHYMPFAGYWNDDPLPADESRRVVSATIHGENALPPRNIRVHVRQGRTPRRKTSLRLNLQEMTEQAPTLQYCTPAKRKTWKPWDIVGLVVLVIPIAVVSVSHG